MNPTEIKNATRQDLVEYLEGWGFAVYPDEPMRDLRSAALSNYWEWETTNNGFSCQTVQGVY